ncbi:hypothetical protein Tco_1245444 [Tanacetum coccineum]
MPYQIYEQLGREEMKKVDKRITMINHTQAEAIGILTNVLCQVRVTTLIAKFLILDIPIDRDSPIPIDRDSPIVVGRGFLHVMRNAESDSDDKEEYHIKRNKFGAPIYGPKPAPYLNCNDPAERSLAIQTVTNPFRKISVWKKAVSFLGSLPVPSKHVNWKPDYKGSYTKEEENPNIGDATEPIREVITSAMAEKARTTMKWAAMRSSIALGHIFCRPLTLALMAYTSQVYYKVSDSEEEDVPQAKIEKKIVKPSFVKI